MGVGVRMYWQWWRGVGRIVARRCDMVKVEDSRFRDGYVGIDGEGVGSGSAGGDGRVEKFILPSEGRSLDRIDDHERRQHFLFA